VRVETDPGQQATEAVFRAVAEAGLALRELRTESATLEDVFADLTTAEEHAARAEQDEDEEDDEDEDERTDDEDEDDDEDDDDDDDEERR
ncbi:MAG: hypothetical protein ACOCUS_04165, partial [Polyangiales bacterium]